MNPVMSRLDKELSKSHTKQMTIEGSKMVNKVILAATFVLSTVVIPVKAASFYSNTIGGTTYYSGDVSGYSSQIGGTTYFNLGGTTGSARRIGDTTYYSGGLTGSSRTIGNTTYHSGTDWSASSRSIGGTTFYSGDVSGSSSTVGGTTYYNFFTD